MRTIMILALLIGSVGYGRSQEIKPSSPEYHYLDSVCRWAIGKFGEEGYTEMSKDVKPRIILRKFVSSLEYNGRECYEVKYMQDTLKPVRLEYNYIARVIIWKDTKEAYTIDFGNGWGHFDLPKMLREEKAGKPIEKVKYVLVDYGALKKEAEEFRKRMEEIDRKARAKSAAKDKERQAKDAEVIRKWEEEVAKRHEKEMAKERKEQENVSRDTSATKD